MFVQGVLLHVLLYRLHGPFGLEEPPSRAVEAEDAFGFGIFAPFVPVLAKEFGMTARNIAGGL